MGKVIDPLTKDELEAWAKELESGKYEQGTGGLCKDGLYCCLGVLAASRGELTEKGEFTRSRDTILRAGWLRGGSRRLYYVSMPQQEALAMRNDNAVPFPEIAAYIRENLIPEAKQ